MPIHDWTRVEACLFQDFRSSWIVAVSDALNRGGLKDGYYALLAPAAVSVAEVVAAPGSIPFRLPWLEEPTDDGMEFYRLRKNHVVIRRSSDDGAVAVVDIVSAGDKASRAAVRTLAERITGVLRRGVNVLLIDVLPPGPHDPHGLHAAVWAEAVGGHFVPPADRPLIAITYKSAGGITAFVEPLAVGDALPDMPLFLTTDSAVSVPLELTYQAAWAGCPRTTRERLQSPPPHD